MYTHIHIIYIILHIVVYSTIQIYSLASTFIHAVSRGTIVSGCTSGNPVLHGITIYFLGLREHFRTKRYFWKKRKNDPSETEYNQLVFWVTWLDRQLRDEVVSSGGIMPGF
jgi:hypothetical protein